MTIMDIFSKAVAADDAAGAALIDCVVYDFMADLVEVNKAELNEVYSMWALDRVQIAKKTLARSYVDAVSKGDYPSDDVHLAAKWLAGIEGFIVAAARNDVSKAADNEWWTVGSKRVQRSVSRDASGRFTRGVNQNLSRSVSPADKERMAPQLKNYSDGVNWIGGMTSTDAATFQGQYEEAVAISNEFKDAIGGAKADVLFLVQGPDGGIRNLRSPMKDVASRGVKMNGLRADDKILGIEVAPSAGASAAEAAKIAEFNLLGGAGGSALAQLANANPDLRANLARSLKMPKASEDKGNLTRLFGILASGGAVLAGVSGSDKIGEMAALVGTMGPQASEVLGPYVKRSAYRYRGTETTPAPEMRDPQAVLSFEQSDKVKRDFPMASGNSLTMHARADAASSILAETIPQDPIVARLSEASGQVLPSQGVMYDQNGKLVSQSVGFTDDHYLPFDLSNLGRLRGGQYVRTRQQGGLTGEDVYTAVMSGARQVQVVSGSGVFTLEMAPDFRGARAMSDKARGMYDRYLKILDAVDESGLYLEDIPSKQKQEIYSQARAALGDNAEDSVISSLAEANIERARRAAQTIEPQDELLAATNALREAGGSPRDGETAMESAKRLRGKERRIFDDAYSENIEEIRASKTNKLRLNAEGYSVALQTLKEQFPYFIADAKYRELRSLPTDKMQNVPKTRRYAQDKGYAQPGSLRARSVETGFYNPGDLEPRAKQQRGRDTREERPEATVESDGSPSVTQPKPEQSTQTQEKAADTGAQTVLNNGNRMTDKILSDAGAAIVEAASALPDLRAANPTIGLPFESLSDKTERVKWLLSQNKAESVVNALTGSTADKAAEALSDETVVRNALTQVLSNDGIDDWFGSGNIFGGQSTPTTAVEWLLGKGKAAGEAAAMKKGLVKSPTKPEDIINHRGLMPLQMSGIANIGTGDEFKRFAAENESIATLARVLAFNGGELQTLPQIAERAGEQLDAIKAIGAAKDAFLSDVRANPSRDLTKVKLSQYATDEEWKKATGQPLPDIVGALSEYDAAAKGMQVQQAWSLAATGRIIEASEGGDVFPKAESRLLEPVGKAARRPLVGPTGYSVDLDNQAKESKVKADRYKKWKKETLEEVA